MKQPKKGDVLYKATYLELEGGKREIFVDQGKVYQVGEAVVFWDTEDDASVITHLGEIEEKWAYSRKAALEKLRSRMQDEIDFLNAGLALVEEELEKA